MFLDNKKIAVISHDAGGAEIISSLIKRNNLNCFFVLAGPAKIIFERKLGRLTLSSIDFAINSSDLLLCGTSWQSDLEINAITQAKILKKHTIVFLDHWVNFIDRFTRNNLLMLPDEIWVGDKYAMREAKKKFSTIEIKLIDNPYFQDIKDEISNVRINRSKNKNKEKLNILYVSEPTKEHAYLRYGDEMYWGYTEDDAIKFFLDNLDVLGGLINKIIIRPHPSEKINKYNWVKLLSPLVTISNKKTLLNQIIESDLVVGCSSMAMVIGLLAKKRVITAIPEGGNLSTLPYNKIESLQKLVLKHKETLNG